MHRWGDEGIDWEAINSAAEMIGDFCSKYGRFKAHSKEKYGTVRVYVSMGWLSLHGLIYPQYVYSPFPDWLWELDCRVIGPALRFFFGKVYFAWNKFIYRKAYKKALHAYPHIREEILCCADHNELLKGL